MQLQHLLKYISIRLVTLYNNRRKNIVYNLYNIYYLFNLFTKVIANTTATPSKIYFNDLKHIMINKNKKYCI